MRLSILNYGLLYVFELEERCIFDLVDLDGIAFDFAQFKKSILHIFSITLTISLFIRER